MMTLEWLALLVVALLVKEWRTVYTYFSIEYKFKRPLDSLKGRRGKLW